MSEVDREGGRDGESDNGGREIGREGGMESDNGGREGGR